MTQRRKSWNKLSHPDKVGTPYGDLMGDDDALERFQDTRSKMFSIRTMQMEMGCRKARHMSKRAYRQFKKEMLEMDDDKPLRDFI